MNMKIYDVIDIVGQENMFKISICGLKPNEMNDLELDALIPLLKEMKNRRNKPNRTQTPTKLEYLIKLLENEPLENISICNALPYKMDDEELDYLANLINIMKLRRTGYNIVENRWKLKKDKILVTFEYNQTIVTMLKGLETAKWNSNNKLWEVHISEWPKVEEIFGVCQPDIEEKYQEWKKEHSVNKLIVTNKKCYLSGMDIPKQEIHLATSFPDPNARHIQSYQNGYWDGRIALYSKSTGEFPYGLLGRVVSVLKQANVEYEYIDERTLPKKEFHWNQNVSLRDYQQETMDKAIKAGRGILQLATGAGKTKTASALVSQYGLKTIFFVHTKFLLGQAKTELENVLGIKVGQVGAGIIDVQPVTVAMVQTTIKALGGEYTPSEDDRESEKSEIEDTTNIEGKEELIVNMLEEAGLIFFDECQFVAADSFYTIANTCNAYFKFGLSATPYRSDKKDLMIEAALGPVIHRIQASYLVKRGFLTKPKIHFYRIPSQNTYGNKNYHTIYQEDIVQNSYRNNKIVNSALKLNERNQSVLILVQQVTHGQLLKKMFSERGVNVEFVSGVDNLEKREEEVYKLRTKKVLTLIASTIADEGLDVPSLDSVILGGGGKSPSKSMQRIGRAIRLFTTREQIFETYNSLKEMQGDKKNCLILVDTIEDGMALREFLIKEDLSNNKVGINAPFIYGDLLFEHKKELFRQMYQHEMPFMISLTSDISMDEINTLKGISSLIVMGAKNFDFSSVDRKIRDVSTIYTQEDLQQVKEACLSSKSNVIFVQESKDGNIVKDYLKEAGFKVKFLTGAKIKDTLDKTIKDIFDDTSDKIYIINSSYIDNMLPFKNVENIFVCAFSKKPFRTLEMFQKDVRIFTLKENAYVIDFHDTAKYLCEHSFERKQMFETEPEFEITGW